MKKIALSLILFGFIVSAKAVVHTITISGFSFSPADLTVFVGDTLNIQASNMHPVNQVSETTWNGNGTTELSGGWGSKTSTFNHKVTTADNIFYVCKNHVGSGMKGKVTVVSLPTTINEVDANKFVLYQVFAKDNVRIDNNYYSSAKISFFDIQGRAINSATLQQGNNTLPFQFSSGNYIYYITSNENSVLKSGKFSVN